MAANTKVDTIIDGIRSRILSGEFGEQGRLPSFRKLVNEYETSQETMNKAMQALQAEGILLSAGAKGVFVNRPRLRVPGMVKNFYEEYLKHELEPFQITIGKPEVFTPDAVLAKRMNLSKGIQVLKRIRKQGAGNVPFRIVEEYFPMSLITDIMLEHIMKDPNFHIIDAIEANFNKTIHSIHEELIARLPTTFEQRELQIVRTNPVISTQLTHYAKDKKTVLTCNNKIMNANMFLLSYDYPVTYWK